MIYLDLSNKTMENKELLSIKSVYKEFEIEGHSEHLKVLENIDLTVKTNEFLSIIGQSGTGKSTLLRSIADFFVQLEVKLLLKIKSLMSLMPILAWFFNILPFSLVDS